MTRDEGPAVEVVLIEDEPEDAHFTRRALERAERHRFNVSHFECIAEALERIEPEGTDTILLDLGLPDAKGFSGLVEIREAFPRIPIVVLTGLEDASVGIEAVRLGAQDYLTKSPASLQSLARVLTYAIERERLRASEAKLLAVVSGTSDAEVVLDADGWVRFCNPAARELFGCTQGQDVRRKFPFPFDLSTPSELEIPRDDEPSRWAEMRVARIEWEGEPSFLASIRDITVRRRNEELEKRLLHADRLSSIGLLAAGVAREVNNPAAYILANTMLLREATERLTAMSESISRLAREEPDPVRHGDWAALLAQYRPLMQLEDMHRMLDDSLGGIDAVRSIVQSLSSFVAIQEDGTQTFDINDMVEEACDMVAGEVRHRASLVKKLGELPRVNADRSTLRHAIVNLLVNAANAFDEGSAASQQITVKTEQTGEGITISVEDTGRGIPEAELNRVLEPFFTTSPRGEGTGLGLTVCEEIVARHGGELGVESEVGLGSRFSIRLPAELVHATAGEPTIPAPPQSTRRRWRLLVVDADARCARAMGRLLRTHHDVEIAANGREALDLVKKHHFDGVLCDLRLPVMDGAQFHSALHRVQPELQPRVVFTSGGLFTKELQSFIRSVDNEVLEKPVHPNLLLTVIERVVERRAVVPKPPVAANGGYDAMGWPARHKPVKFNR